MSTDLIAAPTADAIPARRRRLRLGGKGNGAVVFSTIFMSLMALAALFADFIPGLARPDLAWGAFSQPPSLSLNGLLGTDTLGRSIMSRVIYGARISLTIAIASSIISLAIGITVGMLAGYYRGFVERLADLYSNSIASMPPLLLVLALVAATGASLTTMTIALGFLMSGMYARVTKGAVITLANREYVLAARSLGASDPRILLRELLPNLLPTMTAVVPPTMAIMIVVEGSLSFLGYGIPAPTPSWGGMIASAADVMNRFPYLIIGPVAAIVLTVYSLNTIGDHLAAKVNLKEGQL